MLTDAQRAEFDDLGFVRIRRAFSADAAAAMRAVVWRELECRHGIREEDPRTWRVERPTGLKTAKRNPAFDAIGCDAVNSVFDALMGPGEWTRPRTWGQVMVTFPNAAQPWVVPHLIWHADFPYDAGREPLCGLKVFAFFGDVAPRSGGTLVIARSHRIVARFVDDQDDGLDDTRRTRLCFTRHHPWLRALATATYDTERTARFMDQDTDVDGIPARVVELTGAAGDVVITHPWTMHHAAFNAGHYPRLMRGQSIYRATHPVTAGPS